MYKNITKLHNNQHLANQTLHWFDLDSQELWQANMADPKRCAQLEQFGFDQPDAITYQMNNHGFRCDDFDRRPGFIALGCSFTCGIGLPVQQVWPSIVGQVTRLVPWNLGIGGAGLDTCFRMLYNYIDLLQPEFVMLLTPDPDRFEIHALGIPCMTMHNNTHHNPAIDKVKKFWFSDEQNTNVNYTKNLLAMQQLCNSRNVKLIIKNLYPDLLGKKLTQSNWPTGRDLCHVGYLEQQRCAELFLQALDQN
jgi:hypothetical protein